MADPAAVATSDRKLAVVTGGSAGIGLEIARGLVGAGYRVVLAVRDRERGLASARDIAATAGAAAPVVMVVGEKLFALCASMSVVF